MGGKEGGRGYPCHAIKMYKTFPFEINKHKRLPNFCQKAELHFNNNDNKNCVQL